MIRLLRVCLAPALAAAIACSGISVNTDYDPAYDYSKLRSYHWYSEGSGQTGDPRIDNTLVQQRIHRAVDYQLSRRGFRRAEAPRAADFLVAYNVITEKQLEAQTYHTGYGGYRGGYYGRGGGIGVGVSQTEIREYEVGTLLLDFVDPKTKALLWRGEAKARLDPNQTPERRDALVNEAVSKLLDQFPPKVE